MNKLGILVHRVFGVRLVWINEFLEWFLKIILYIYLLDVYTR